MPAPRLPSPRLSSPRVAPSGGGQPDAHDSSGPVTLADISAAVRAGYVPLAAETAGYLALALADNLARTPTATSASALILSPEGSVSLLGMPPPSRGSGDPSAAAERFVRELLGRWLESATSPPPALKAVARRGGRGADSAGVEALIVELEEALIPVNRSAARRGLSRLAREAQRARAAGLPLVPPGSPPRPTAPPQRAARPAVPAMPAAPARSAPPALPAPPRAEALPEPGQRDRARAEQPRPAPVVAVVPSLVPPPTRPVAPLIVPSLLPPLVSARPPEPAADPVEIPVFEGTAIPSPVALSTTLAAPEAPAIAAGAALAPREASSEELHHRRDAEFSEEHREQFPEETCVTEARADGDLDEPPPPQDDATECQEALADMGPGALTQPLFFEPVAPRLHDPPSSPATSPDELTQPWAVHSPSWPLATELSSFPQESCSPQPAAPQRAAAASTAAIAPFAAAEIAATQGPAARQGHAGPRAPAAPPRPVAPQGPADLLGGMTPPPATVEALLGAYLPSDGLDEQAIGRALKLSVGLEPTAMPPSVDLLASGPGDAGSEVGPAEGDDHATVALSVNPPRRSRGSRAQRPPRSPRASMALLFLMLMLGLCAVVFVWVRFPGFFLGHL
jgi:hypothetical protein